MRKTLLTLTLGITSLLSATAQSDWGYMHESRMDRKLILSSIKSDTYTLTDDDVVMKDGVLIDCTYAFRCNHLIIPEILDFQHVVQIGDLKIDSEKHGIFSRYFLSSVTLPNTVKRIGNFAFANNIMETINICNCKNLEVIGEGAFQNNKTKDIDLSGCSKLTLIKLDAFTNTTCPIKLPHPHSKSLELRTEDEVDIIPYQSELEFLFAELRFIK